MAREGATNRRRTEQQVKADDKIRKKFVEMFYGQKWDMASDFDLVIDTSAISIEMAGNWILEAVRALESKEFGADVLTAQGIKVDPLLEDAIEQALERRIPSSDDGPKSKSE